jgi:hypothetical protein
MNSKQISSSICSIRNNKYFEHYPNGLPTKDLIGAPRFHGMRTLTSRQIPKILKITQK